MSNLGKRTERFRNCRVEIVVSQVPKQKNLQSVCVFFLIGKQSNKISLLSERIRDSTRESVQLEFKIQEVGHVAHAVGNSSGNVVVRKSQSAKFG